VLLWLLGGLLFVFAIVVALLLALLSASIASAPFLDLLSLRVERLVAPADVPSQSRGVVADGLRSLWNETRRVSFFAALWLAISLAGALIPGGAIVAGPLLLLLTVFFLPLDYTGYSLDRRAVPFDRRRGWIRANWATMLGFGGTAFALGVVPGLNLLLLPLLVVGGTLLVLRHPLA
jgi:CysZ protein